MINKNIKSDNQVTSFSAKTINVGNIENSYFLIFYNLEQYFLLQKAHNFDEQDSRNKTDTYYIEYSDQSRAIFGGVENVVLYRNKINFKLSNKASEALKMSSELSIEFKANEANYEKMKEELRYIFSEENCFIVAPINKNVIIDYTNWRGERGLRRILPIEVFFGINEFHPGEQWLLKAIDLDKNVERVFAMKDIHSWQ